MASRTLKNYALSYAYINKYFMIAPSQAGTKCNRQFLCNQNFPVSRLNYSTTSVEAAKTNVDISMGPKPNPGNLDSFRESNEGKKWNIDEKSAAKLIQKSDPDTFGTLNAEKTKRLMFDKILDDLPEEEGDKIEENYVDPVTRRKRLKLQEYAKIIRNYIEAKRIKDAINVLEVRMLKEERAKPDYYIYNLLISACGHQGYTKKAFQLFNDMKKRGLRPTSASYTALFNACANSPFPEYGLKQAMHLKGLMEEKSIFIEPITYHAMIKAFGRCGATDIAFTLVDEMIEKKLPLTSETFNFLLQACISDKEVGYRHALFVWQKLRRKWINPSVYTYNLLLRTVRECGIGDPVAFQEAINQIVHKGVPSPTEYARLKDGKSLLSRQNPNERTIEPLSFSVESTEQSSSSGEMTTVPPISNIPLTVENRPNLLAYKPVLGSILVVDEVKTPQDRLILLGGINGVLKEMESDGVKPTISTFSLFLDIIPGTLSAEKALLSVMKQHNITPNHYFFNILIKKRALRFDYESARDVLKMLQAHNLEPDIMTFGALALSCKKKTDADNLLKGMSDAGFIPNIEILGSMMRNACCQYSFGYIVYLMKYVENEEIMPNEIFLKHLKYFYENCLSCLKKVHRKEDANIPAFFNSPTFQEGFTLFQKFYQHWVKTAKIESELHPWAEVRKKSSKSNQHKKIDHDD